MNVDPEALGGRLEQRRRPCGSPSWAPELGRFYAPMSSAATRLDEDDESATYGDMVVKGEELLKPIALHHRRALREDDVGHVHVEHVGDAAGERLERAYIRTAVLLCALAPRVEVGVELAVHAPISGFINAGLASESAMVPCVPLMAREKTAYR